MSKSKVVTQFVNEDTDFVTVTHPHTTTIITTNIAKTIPTTKLYKEDDDDENDDEGEKSKTKLVSVSFQKKNKTLQKIEKMCYSKK